uniref:DnaJ homolog subfamily B member 9 n=2 Tax=Cyprinus carpio TaxID=7962 RepID=A0A8C1LBS6_CYPCA
MTEHLCMVLLLCVCACNCLSDYYSVLGVSHSASSREIKKAFHKLALKHHPDRNQSPNAQQTFTHIARDYEVLFDREKKRIYDQMDHLTNPVQDRKRDKMGFQHFSLGLCILVSNKL